MTDILSSEYWQSEFDITEDDLERIATRMREEKRAFNVDKMTRRIVRGRLLHGPDYSPTVLSEWLGDEKVLSWDEEESWEIGSNVLVARRIDGNVKPFIGTIKDANKDMFFIHLEEDEEVKYARVEPDSQQAKKYLDNIREAILEKERAARKKQLRIEDQEYVESTLLKHGSRIASRLLSALEKNNQFCHCFNERWFLKELLVDVPDELMDELHQQMLTDGDEKSLSEMLYLIGWQETDANLFSLHHILQLYPDRFKVLKEGWRALQLPPPLWDQAKGVYYVYDPETYEIILQPGQALKKSVAERLEKLGWYGDVVTAQEEIS